jgi:CRISPR-associated protein Cst2
MANLFCSVLTHVAPSSNYRGESEENRTVIQKITRDGVQYAVISPDAMRNALRDMLAKRGLPCNRSRVHDADQPAVVFKAFPDASKYADDFLFGFLVADTAAVKKNKGQPAKRDSVLRMNLAVALAPYSYDATFHQSPLNAEPSPWKNSSTSALLHREVTWTAFQYPFALNLDDCLKGDPAWTRTLLACIGELSDVAGSHARSFYEMAPRSLVARLTPSCVAGFDTYGFAADGSFADLARFREGDLPVSELWLGGEIVRGLPAEQRAALTAAGAHLYDNPQAALQALADVALRAA